MRLKKELVMKVIGTIRLEIREIGVWTREALRIPPESIVIGAYEFGHSSKLVFNGVDVLTDTKDIGGEGGILSLDPEWLEEPLESLRSFTLGSSLEMDGPITCEETKDEDGCKVWTITGKGVLEGSRDSIQGGLSCHCIWSLLKVQKVSGTFGETDSFEGYNALERKFNEGWFDTRNQTPLVKGAEYLQQLETVGIISEYSPSQGVYRRLLRDIPGVGEADYQLSEKQLIDMRKKILPFLDALPRIQEAMRYQGLTKAPNGVIDVKITYKQRKPSWTWVYAEN